MRKRYNRKKCDKIDKTKIPKNKYKKINYFRSRFKFNLKLETAKSFNKNQ